MPEGEEELRAKVPKCTLCDKDLSIAVTFKTKCGHEFTLDHTESVQSVGSHVSSFRQAASQM